MGTKVNVTSMYGKSGRQPLVTLGWGDLMPRQMSPDEAREIARMLLEAAEAADQDGFIVEFAQRGLGQTEETAVCMLAAFREWREQARAKEA